MLEMRKTLGLWEDVQCPKDIVAASVCPCLVEAYVSGNLPPFLSPIVTPAKRSGFIFRTGSSSVPLPVLMSAGNSKRRATTSCNSAILGVVLYGTTHSLVRAPKALCRHFAWLLCAVFSAAG